jgi:hypothetical protein
VAANASDDPTIEFVEITLSGKICKLCWDFNSLAIAEQETKTNLLDGIFHGLTGGATCTQIRALLYAAMLKAQPKVTLEEVGSLIRLNHVPLIIKALSDAYKASIPEDERSNPIDGQGAEGEQNLPTN